MDEQGPVKSCCAGTENDLCIACQVPALRNASREHLESVIQRAQHAVAEHTTQMLSAIEHLRRLYNGKADEAGPG